MSMVLCLYVTTGFKPDLFEHLFFKPSSLQESLAHTPGLRTPEHVEIIASTLRLVPLLVKLRDDQIQELAAGIGKEQCDLLVWMYYRRICV
jgi:hypothetical protein